MANLAQKVCGMMEECTKPRVAQQGRRASPLISTPWAWRALLFSWRRFVRKNPPKPPVIKPAISTAAAPAAVKPSPGMKPSNHGGSPARGPESKRAKSGPIPTSHPTSHNRYFYNSEGNSSNGSSKGMRDAQNIMSREAKTRCHSVRGRCRCASRPTASSRSCVYDDPVLSDPHLDIHYTLPYLHLRRSRTPPPPSASSSSAAATARHPIYIVT